MKLLLQKLPSARVDATSRYDITIAGAGPAGSLLALLAARARYRVLLIEKSQFDSQRLGETAPPELRQALTRVGLERLAQAPFCRDAPEVLSVWGSNEPRSRHHIFSPYGTALHLDRRAFDEALAFAAREPGACFHGRLPYDRNHQGHFCLPRARLRAEFRSGNYLSVSVFPPSRSRA